MTTTPIFHAQLDAIFRVMGDLMMIFPETGLPIPNWLVDPGNLVFARGRDRGLARSRLQVVYQNVAMTELVALVALVALVIPLFLVALVALVIQVFLLFLSLLFHLMVLVVLAVLVSSTITNAREARHLEIIATRAQFQLGGDAFRKDRSGSTLRSILGHTILGHTLSGCTLVLRPQGMGLNFRT